MQFIQKTARKNRRETQHRHQQGVNQFRHFLKLCLLLLLGMLGQNAYCAPKTMLVLGDSLSAEYGLARGSGWVALLEKRLQEKKIAVNVVNASISGETTSGGKTRLPALLALHKPNVVIIELGGNDGMRGLSLPAFAANMQSMISEAQKSGAKVLLLGMHIPPNYGREYTTRFHATYTELASKNKIALTPFFLQGVAEKPAMFQADNIHPLATAHPIMLDNAWPQIQAILQTK